MRRFAIAPLLLAALTRGICGSCDAPPRILWPADGSLFGGDVVLRIKADPGSGTNALALVNFIVNDEVIGTATNAPFMAVWSAERLGYATIRVSGTNSAGVNVSSSPVTIALGLGPVEPVVQIISPRNGEYLPAGVSTELTAEAVASLGNQGPIDFYSGTNFLGRAGGLSNMSATDRPLSVTLSNTPSGDFPITVRFPFGNGSICTCKEITNVVHFVELGLNAPRIDCGSNLMIIPAVTSSPGIETFLLRSEDFAHWTVVQTKTPATNLIQFELPVSLATPSTYYRLLREY